MQAGLIIVHWNRPSECARTVQAFRRQGVDLSVFVVDSGSRSGELNALRCALSGVEIISLAHNVGYGPGMNVGLARWLAATTQPWVALAPHDALPHPGCLPLLLETLASRPRAGIACAEFGLPVIPRFEWLRGLSQAPCSPADGWQPIDFPNGTLMVLRRQMVEEIGLFSEQYFAYGDEAEFAARARRAGWEIGQVWGAVVENPTREASSRLVRYLLMRNNLLATYQIAGAGPALLATLVSLVNVVRFLVRPSLRLDGYSTRLRLRAIKDFWLGRLGKPSADLFL
jgi:GT2 family glycosyltransferase